MFLLGNKPAIRDPEVAKCKVLANLCKRIRQLPITIPDGQWVENIKVELKLTVTLGGEEKKKTQLVLPFIMRKDGSDEDVNE